jgi:hypothetical protein
MDEHVLTAVIRLHKAITTTTIETDYGTGRSHWNYLTVWGIT